MFTHVGMFEVAWPPSAVILEHGQNLSRYISSMGERSKCLALGDLSSSQKSDLLVRWWLIRRHSKAHADEPLHYTNDVIQYLEVQLYRLLDVPMLL